MDCSTRHGPLAAALFMATPLHAQPAPEAGLYVDPRSPQTASALQAALGLASPNPSRSEAQSAGTVLRPRSASRGGGNCAWGGPAHGCPVDPLDPKAAVPALTHASPLARYKPAGDVTLVPWKEANDTTARIGGWRVYAREADPPEPAPPPASAPAASRPMPGHGTHGGVAP